MWFNSTLNEKPHQGLKLQRKLEETRVVFTRDGGAGDAWLSSVRGLSCSLKWGNERNPCRVLQVSRETDRLCAVGSGDDAKSACPFDALGYTHDTMAVTTGCDEETLS